MRNVPNILSGFRLLLIPAFIAIYFSDIPGAYAWAAGVYLLALFTDMLDGYIARRFHAVSRLGRILDPLADKLMGITVLVCMTLTGILPLWVVLIFIGKDLFLILGSAFLLKQENDVFSANYVGKTATFLLCTVSVILLVFSGIDKTLADVLIAVTLAVSLASMAVYIVQYFRKDRKS